MNSKKCVFCNKTMGNSVYSFNHNGKNYPLHRSCKDNNYLSDIAELIENKEKSETAKKQAGEKKNEI